MNFKALLNTLGTTSTTLPIVILYVTEGCNLQCLSCSYREPLPNELSLSEIDELARALARFGLRRIVYSGGEPLVRRDFKKICEIFQHRNVQQTLLTNGLLLEKLADDLREYCSEIIVSIDGANEQIHNTIRGVHSFNQITKGIIKLTQYSPRPRISTRTVLQKNNFRQVMEMVDLGKSLGVDRVSFLSADVSSLGFGREMRGSISPNGAILLNESEAAEFRELVEKMVVDYRRDFEKRFIGESPGKLFHIVQYFEAMLGKAPFPLNRCNAPNISTVITSTGEVKPCYFLPAVGNIRSYDITEIANNPNLREIRKNVKNLSLEECKRCVCTLYISPVAAFLDRF